MSTIAIITYVITARHALEALADRLRRGVDASLETAEACTALRALADAWARVLPKLPADVTPPEWPVWRARCSPDSLAWQIERGYVTATEARSIYAYADGLRAWGREAAACEEEAEPEGDAGGADAEPARCVGCNICGCGCTAPSVATVHARLLADSLDPDATPVPFRLSALASDPVEALPVAGDITSGGPTVRADVAPCGHSSRGVCSDCGWCGHSSSGVCSDCGW